MPLRFRKQWVAAQPYEAAAIADVNGDGHPDILSGAWWYEGPDFMRKHKVWDPPPAAGGRDYHDDFSGIVLRGPGGGVELVTGGYFGKTLFLLSAPPGGQGEWAVREIARPGSIETTRAWDVDGDGELEIVPNVPQGPLIVYKRQPDGTFAGRRLWDGPQGHGLGFGDVNGDGRPDFVFAGGWLEAPADPEAPWTFHRAWNLERPSIPMLVVDVDGDGRNEIIAGAAHSYGLDWLKAVPGEEALRWSRHPIDPFNSQYHDLAWVDLDGDGAPELVTGKRYWAHCGSDPGERDDLGLYYFKWTGAGFAKQVVDYGPVGIGKGCGIHFAVGDLNGDGRPEIVAPGKDGLAVYWNLGP